MWCQHFEVDWIYLEYLLQIPYNIGMSTESDKSKQLPVKSGDISLPDAGRAVPKGKEKASYLVDETMSMERQRRLKEQQGHRRLGRVNAREHGSEDNRPRGNALEAGNEGPLQHPDLNTPRFDGVDQTLNPEYLSPEARREFDNQKRQQDMEKQLRLGNMPKFNSAPKPSWGS